MCQAASRLPSFAPVAPSAGTHCFLTPFSPDTLLLTLQNSFQLRDTLSLLFCLHASWGEERLAEGLPHLCADHPVYRITLCLLPHPLQAPRGQYKPQALVTCVSLAVQAWSNGAAGQCVLNRWTLVPLSQLGEERYLSLPHRWGAMCLLPGLPANRTLEASEGAVDSLGPSAVPHQGGTQGGGSIQLPTQLPQPDLSCRPSTRTPCRCWC